ncbi:hypothetical protein BGZ82_002148 [Podila clonocystis]|nr:hypothetical protein BGZ82_002148 [Podila clonocystis]
MLRNTITDNLMRVFCLVDGELTSHAFSVANDPNKTVDRLKKLIKTKKSNEFSDIDADTLTLWHVSIPITEDDEIPILLNLVASHKKKLGPATRLSNIFPKELPEEMVHIIVQRPPQQKDWNEVFTEIETEFFASESNQVTNLHQGAAQPLVPKLAGIVRTAGPSKHCGQGSCEG